jgi:hypothetical protein
MSGQPERCGLFQEWITRLLRLPPRPARVTLSDMESSGYSAIGRRHLQAAINWTRRRASKRVSLAPCPVRMRRDYTRQVVSSCTVKAHTIIDRLPKIRLWIPAGVAAETNNHVAAVCRFAWCQDIPQCFITLLVTTMPTEGVRYTALPLATPQTPPLSVLIP